MTAGEKRKFYRNMEYQRSSRRLAVLGLQMFAICAPIALVLIAAIALVSAFTHHDVLGALHLHGHGGVLTATVPGVFSVKARELREKRAAIWTQAQEILKKENLTAEDRQKFDAHMAECDSLKADIDRLEKGDNVDHDLRTTVRPGESRIDPSQGDRKPSVTEFRNALRVHGTRALEHVSAESRKVVMEMRRQFFDNVLKDYLAHGEAGMTPDNRAILRGDNAEFRDMGVGVNSLGGFFVPQGFVYDVEEALKYYGDMLNVAEIMDTATGQPLPYPTDNDTTIAGELIGEGQQVTAQDVTIGHITYGAFKFSTKMIKVSIELLQDSAFDLDSYLRKKMAVRLGRILNTKFTVGAGTTEPNGIITAMVANNGAPAVGFTATGVPVIAQGSNANDGSGSTGTNSIGYADLVNLEHSVDPLYRRGAKFMFHDSTLRFLKTLLDKFGRPLWVPGVTSNSPDTILDYEYSINNDMDQIGASKNTVAFGQLNKYLIRRVKELAVLRLSERFADYGQVAFLGFARYDGNLLDAGTHPVNYLQQHS